MKQMPGTKILIVDDDQSFVEALLIFLEDHGLMGKAAYTGHGSLEEADRYRPDLMILDFNLPDMDGIQVVQQVRKKTVQIPIIMISGDDSEETRSRCESVASLFLAKPVSPLELLGHAKRLLDSRRIHGGKP